MRETAFGGTARAGDGIRRTAHKEVARHCVDSFWDDEPASGAHFLGQLVLQL